MSYYYNYYLGYQTPDGKIFPLGPYNYRNELQCVLSISKSFASDLYEDFYALSDTAWSEELEKQFSYQTYEGKKERYKLKYLLLSGLPKGSFIKTGYYLIEDINRYLRSQEDDDVYFEDFYDFLTPETYVRKMENELKFGPPKPRTNDFGEEYTPHSCADYSYFCYPDYNCKEYECFIIREIAEIMNDYKLPKDSKIVVLETEG